MGKKVLTGLDIFVKDRFSYLKGKKVALLTHAPSVDSDYNHIIDLMERYGVDLVTIFEPEHGIFGAMQDMETVSNHSKKTVTLYGDSYETLFPKKVDLEGIDTVVIDIQDIGARYYTYIYTASFFLPVAKELDIEVVLLDRPNPINCTDIEGNFIKEGFNSFVGFYNYFPNRHGLTAGEMLQVINQKYGANLNVIAMDNYRSSLNFNETGLPWVLTSPNMPTLNTAFLYPGGCLIEGTNLSEGRGTTKPFHFVGAPYIDGKKLKNIMDSQNLDGVSFRAVRFKPMFQKHALQNCEGVEVHITDLENFNSLLVYFTLIYEVYHNFNKDFRWRTETYEFVDDPIAIDLLFGTDIIRKEIEKGGDPFNIYQKHLIEGENFHNLDSIKPYLIY